MRLEGLAEACLPVLLVVAVTRQYLCVTQHILTPSLAVDYADVVSGHLAVPCSCMHLDFRLAGIAT